MSEKFFHDSNEKESSENSVNNIISTDSTALSVYNADEDYIFVSYLHIDSKEVFKDINVFHDEGVNIWYDERLTISQEWNEVIEEALINSSIVVAFMSPDSIESQFFKNEIFLALDKKIPVIPIYIKETDLDLGLKLILGKIQSIYKYQMDVSDYYSKCFEFFNKINPNFNINDKPKSKKSDSRLTSKYLKEFEELNTTTNSIYDLEDNDVLIILRDGTNLTNWGDVKNKHEIIYVSEDLSDYADLSDKYKNLTSLKAIVTLGAIDKVTNVFGMFSGCNNLADISSLKDWNASNITNMKRMFRDCTSLVEISSLKDWDVSNVSNMQGIFYGCTNLVDISGLKDWDVSNVTHMPGLFEDCSSLEDISGLKDWDVSNATNMQGLFYACSKLFDVSSLKNWNVLNVVEMEGMFWDCNTLVDLSGLQNWNVSGVRHMDYMFRDCSGLVDISNIKDWDVSNVSHMKSMFSGCAALVDLSDLDDWDVSNTNINHMFDDCDSIKIYPKWDERSNVINKDDVHDFDELSPETVGDDENIPHMDVPITAYEGEGHFAFISYSHRDYKTVFDEIERFNRQGLNIWFDEGISPGSEWLTELGEALSNASLFIVFISPNSVSSKYVRKEITFAINHDIPFIAIHIEKTDLPVNLDFALGDLQAIPKYGMNDDEYCRRYTKAFNKILKNHGIELKSVDEL